jgi:uncharacterized protein
MSAGRFIWYDLMTNDLANARKFYSDIIGWKTKPYPGGSYELWSAPDADVGGLMEQTSGERAARVPPMWLGYIAVDNVDGKADRAVKMRGKVLSPPRDIPDVGRFAVVSDPQGAAFALFTPKGPQGGGAPSREGVGHFNWAELNTTDWKAAWGFYAELFGWQKTSSMDMGAGVGEYFMFGTDSKDSFGGMSNAANLMKAPAHWLHYINVRSVDETTRRIPQSGGKVLNGPMDVPGGGRIAQCMDPQGGMFAIISSTMK